MPDAREGGPPQARGLAFEVRGRIQIVVNGEDYAMFQAAEMFSVIVRGTLAVLQDSHGRDVATWPLDQVRKEVADAR